jgi:hypothetical protein
LSGRKGATIKIAVVYRSPALDVETYEATCVADANLKGLIFHAGVGDGVPS